MIAESDTSSSIVSAIAALVQAAAWPIVALLFLVCYRAKLSNILDVLTQKLKEAKYVKAGQVEIDTAEQINQVVSSTGESANVDVSQRKVPKSQIKAAELVSKKLEAAPIPYSQKVDLAYQQVYDLVDEYERIRREQQPGSKRTRIMNEIAAKMRALAVVVYPLLPTLMSGQRTGERLAAICALQVRPELGRFDWLVDRVMQEEQPFVFFHASLAILELIKSNRLINREVAEPRIRAALAHMQGFREGRPDQNTIDVLNEALEMLQAHNRTT